MSSDQNAQPQQNTIKYYTFYRANITQALARNVEKAVNEYFSKEITSFVHITTPLVVVTQEYADRERFSFGIREDAYATNAMELRGFVKGYIAGLQPGRRNA